MSLIEGIGDDLLCVLVFLVFIGIVSLAWLSTHVNHIQFPSTLFIIERRTRRRNEDEAERSSTSPPPSHEATPTPSLVRQDQPAERESDIESSEIEETNPEQTTAPTSTNETATVVDEEPSLQIVIKFLNETQRSISAHPNDTISKIKQSHFASELANNQMVRFIYQGRELQDRETLRTCNIRDQTVIHCQISNRRIESSRSRADGHSSTPHIHAASIDTSPVNISSQFVLLLTLILGFIWYLRIKYRLLFSPISTIILILITIIFLIFTCGSLLSTRRTAANTRASRTTIAITPIQHVHLD